MKTLIIFLSFILLVAIQAQTVYEVQPGKKGNQIKLTVSNISETEQAQNVKITLLKQSSFVAFKNETETVETIEPCKEELITFTFDINRIAPVNKKDTIDFMITDANGTSVMKSFIFSYIPPKEFKLEQNFPNPFNPTTTIQYQLPADSKVTLMVYDILGSEVTTLVNEEQEAGYKEVKFNGSQFSSGVYVYRLIAGPSADGFISTKKMMIVK